MVRKARLELARVAPPGPKPGASTNSATFASEQLSSIAESPWAALRAKRGAPSGGFPGRRQAVFQHKGKWAVALERGRLAGRMHPGPGTILEAGVRGQGI